MKKRNNKLIITEENVSKIITKVSLVIYSILTAALLIIFITVSSCLKDWSYLWGFFLCLGPGILFVLASCYFSFEKIVHKDASKKLIAWFAIIYVLKYALILCIPIIGIKFPTPFNRWAMLTETLIAPIMMSIIKLIISNKIIRKDENLKEKPKNTIKF